MNKKLKVLVKVIDNIIEKYPSTKEFIDSNMKEVCEGESMTVEDLFCWFCFEAKLFTRCSLLVEIHSSLITRCKITRYSLQNSLVIPCRSCLLQKITLHSL